MKVNILWVGPTMTCKNQVIPLLEKNPRVDDPLPPDDGVAMEKASAAAADAVSGMTKVEECGRTLEEVYWKMRRAVRGNETHPRGIPVECEKVFDTEFYLEFDRSAHKVEDLISSLFELKIIMRVENK